MYELRLGRLPHIDQKMATESSVVEGEETTVVIIVPKTRGKKKKKGNPVLMLEK